MADDPIERMLKSLAENLASEYNETIYQIVSALQHNGVSKEEIHAVMGEVPSIAGEYMGDETKNNMALLDLVFIGLVVHKYRGHFIEERNESGEGEEPPQ